MCELSMGEKYPLVCGSIWGCFRVKMDLDNSLHSVLNAKETPYDYQDQSFDSPRFWMNTQFMIYHVCEREESLMGILFNKLNNMVSLYLESGIGTESCCELQYDSVRRNLYIKILYETGDVFDDSLIYKQESVPDLSSIETLVRYGYQNAEKIDITGICIRIKHVKDLIDETIASLQKQILNSCPRLLDGEDWNDFQHLLRVALAYGFPTKKYPFKKYSALTKAFYTVEETNRKEELSCGGEFIIWDPKIELKPLFDQSGRDLSFLLEYLDFQNDVLVKSARETTRQMTGIIKHESIRSAIAAIMSRNMSHNLGSHYLYYTKAYLDTLASSVNNSNSPDIRGAAKVLGYMQARMDYLATIISNDKYPYGPVNFKSQIYDELTIDDFSKRHFPFGIDNNGEERSYKRITNFLLSNLVLSEDFTRPGILSAVPREKHDQLRLQMKFQYGPDQPFKVFTGTDYDDSFSFLLGDDLATIQSETEVKNAISSIDIGLPGGIMSCHAFFNVIENFIRNSAKYNREDFELTSDGESKVLTVTIAIRPEMSIQSSDGGYRFLDFIIYDNKKNATFYKKAKEDEGKTLYESIVDKLGGLKILDDSNAIEKENKGLKEMLFSSAWMRAYTYGAGKNFTDIIVAIQNAKSDFDRLELIKAHWFEFIAVEDKEDGKLEIFEGKDVREKASERPVNLGLMLRLPLFRKKEVIDGSLSWPELVANSLDVFADIVEVKERTEDLSKIYTRVFVNDEGMEVGPVDAYKKILQARFKDFDKYRLVFGTVGDPPTKTSDNFTIMFTHHMSSTLKGHLKDQAVYAYSDTESGGNFTKTMNELFVAGLQPGANWEEAEYFRLKIRESALTRITLIDERLHRNMVNKKESDVELALKNIRVLNYIEPENVSTFMDFFKGNSFYDVNHHYRTNPDYSHFVSIHLGLIEKIICSRPYLSFCFSPFKEDGVPIYGERSFDEAGNAVWVTMDSDGKENRYSIVGLDSSNLCCGQLRLEDKARVFMYLLRDAMGGSDCYVTIHSGRGNYSKELEGPLDSFPFVSLSSIESAFNNSKMLLSQLFYNTRYVGKGVYNSKNKKV